MTDDIFRTIVRCQEQGQACALASVVRTLGSTPGKVGAKLLVTEDGRFIGTVGGGCVENEVWQIARKTLSTGEPVLHHFTLTADEAADEGLACGGQLDVFIEPILTPTAYIFGAGHIGAQVARLAAGVGFKSVVLDDRASFANPTNIPEAHELVVAPFDEMLATLDCRPHTYVVIVTRGHRYDERCLHWALTQPDGRRPRYVGMISSRAKRKVVYRRLREQGILDAAIDTVHSPIGLAIGALTPAEIAIAIVAELIAERRQADRDRLPNAEAPAWEELRAHLGLAESAEAQSESELES